MGKDKETKNPSNKTLKSPNTISVTLSLLIPVLYIYYKDFVVLIKICNYA